MKRTAIITNRRGALRGALSVALLTGLALSPAALAKPGGNGGGKGGGNGGGGDGGGDPPAVEAPVKYQLSWVERTGYHTRVRSINASGTAVGWRYPIAESTDPSIRRPFIPVLLFSDGREIDLQSLLSPHPDFPTDPDPDRRWDLRGAWTISNTIQLEHEGELVNAFVVAGDFLDPDGKRHCFAARLADNGASLAPTVHWFRWLSAGDVGAPAELGATVWDSSGNGMLAISISDPSEGAIYRSVVWNPHANEFYGPFAGEESSLGLRINSSGLLLLEKQNRIIDYLGGTEAPLPAGGVRVEDIADDGTLAGSAFISDHPWREREKAARFTADGWEQLDPDSRDSGRGEYINSAGDIIGRYNACFFLYLNDGASGIHLLDDLIDPESNPDALAIWASLDAGFSHPSGAMNAISDPDDSGYGWICGTMAIDDHTRFAGFILRPIAAQ